MDDLLELWTIPLCPTRLRKGFRVLDHSCELTSESDRVFCESTVSTARKATFQKPVYHTRSPTVSRQCSLTPKDTSLSMMRNLCRTTHTSMLASRSAFQRESTQYRAIPNVRTSTRSCRLENILQGGGRRVSMGIFKQGRPSRQKPPRRPGLYGFRDKRTGTVDYVGETSDLFRRIGEHFLSDSPVSSETHHAEWQAADGRSTSKTRRRHESRKIDELNPRMNRRRGGGGRTSRR